MRLRSALKNQCCCQPDVVEQRSVFSSSVYPGHSDSAFELRCAASVAYLSGMLCSSYLVMMHQAAALQDSFDWYLTSYLLCRFVACFGGN
jgi:hypothetical protein